MKSALARLLTVSALTASFISTPCIAFADDAPAKTPPAKTDPPTTKPDENGPQKFYGPISAIDTDAKTITVGDQVFHVVGETQMTKAADDSAATLADATVGQPARGSYTKSADGKLNLTKVRFGRKTGGKAGGKSGGKKKTDDAPKADDTQKKDDSQKSQ
jgi:hypothetical protein